ncbi:hypothetical protein PF005_g27119 [Phytophthora fragariae]|uniref:Uncharacterized protein n=1 Tax=Phytophthora fragariae TaxID=53985 RepID=A0A6A3QUZ7_9STRA|nr:hypothetical protein PF006_g26613 [Phytophthora fragariae]KAE9094413.1 hypothetical protein PF007_g17772 [Phytophthora fragariae]KAE9171506.1 hypothetical protein PF005_g27119 [Phytophthora fragariae]KAE9275527.1 hypothetical protein PF001_g26541 [Phytophthora fragariae]
MSCRFMRLSCRDEDHPLFRRESNRERGVKLLRCFPHCCPEHARRSYCGCSVYVLVTFASSVSAAELDDIVVCARFEPSRVAPRGPTRLGNLAGLSLGAGGSAAEDQVGHGHGETGDERRLEDERRLGVGESVALPASLFSPSGRRSSMESVWIRADRESDARQRAFPKVRECAGSVD